MQETLSQPERNALKNEDAKDVLRDGLCVRWRLAMAADLLPAAQDQVDQAALDALLLDVDTSLEALRNGTSELPEVALAIDRNCETLMRAAVAFSGRVKSSAPAPEAGVAALGANKTDAREKKTKDKSDAKAKQKKAQRSFGQDSALKKVRPLYVTLALAVVAAVGFQVYDHLPRKPPPSSVPGLPPNLAVIPSPGGTMMVTTTTGTPFDASQEAWLMQQEGKGFQVKRGEARNSAMLIPANPSSLSRKPPQTAGNDKP